jgi:hypothetical protein
MTDTVASLARKKLYSDVYYLYEITGTGAAAGDDKKEFVAYDLGIYRGYKDPLLVYRLDSDGTEDGGTWVAGTTECTSASGSTFIGIRLADVQYDALYIGFTDKFTGLSIDIDTAGVDAGTLVATWEYPSAVSDIYEPTTWSDLNEEDNTASAAGKGLDAGTSTYSVEWEIPTDWVEATLDSTDSILQRPQSRIYWVKFMVGTAGYSTAPLIERIRLVRPLPATSLTLLDYTDDACDIYLNTTNTAGTETAKTNIPVAIYQEHEIDDFYIHNFTVESLANTKVIKLWVEAHAGEWD